MPWSDTIEPLLEPNTICKAGKNMLRSALSTNLVRGETDVLTYAIEELLATKLRALYQRKKGRDLYDFWYALLHFPEINVSKIIDIF